MAELTVRKKYEKFHAVYEDLYSVISTEEFDIALSLLHLKATLEPRIEDGEEDSDRATQLLERLSEVMMCAEKRVAIVQRSLLMFKIDMSCWGIEVARQRLIDEFMVKLGDEEASIH